MIRGLGLPFWLAGSQGSPQGLRSATAAGAAGVQVGTAFAFCAEVGSGRQAEAAGAARPGRRATYAVRTDWRVSPTGFPFKVLDLAGTLADS